MEYQLQVMLGLKAKDPHQQGANFFCKWADK
jgi:hypothetical protein